MTVTWSKLVAADAAFAWQRNPKPITLTHSDTMHHSFFTHICCLVLSLVKGVTWCDSLWFYVGLLHSTLCTMLKLQEGW